MNDRISDPPDGIFGGSGGIAAPRDAAVLRDSLVGLIENRWWLGDDALGQICRYALTPSGKLLRPLLLLESALAVGGDPAHVMPAAVGTECAHVASLMHDDIIDSDDVRRGRPSAWSRFGTGRAVIGGDALIFDLFLCLTECLEAGVPAQRVVTAMEIVARSGLDICRGQSIEEEFTRDQVGGVGRYLEMIALKTAALFRGACQSGAVLAGAPPEWSTALSRYGTQMGLAFQIRDDLLAYTGDVQGTGKPADSDIRNSRPTLPLLLAREGGGPHVARLDEALSGAMEPDEALRLVTDIVHRTGAVDRCVERAHRHVAAARRELAVLPASPSRDRLDDLAVRSVDRAR